MKKKRLLTDRSQQFAEELTTAMVKEMAEEEDWEILCDMLLTHQHWTKVNIEWSTMTESQAHQIKQWCQKNLSGDFKARGRTWMFEQQRDASMFLLRWR
jgi:hypothetical protein